MKRDMDLIRQILLRIEESPSAIDIVPMNNFQNHKTEEVQYQLYLLNQAGLIEAHDASSGGGLVYMPFRLTWQGHEFIDSARDDDNWNKAKTVITKIGGFTFSILSQLLVSYLKQQAGLP